MHIDYDVIPEILFYSLAFFVLYFFCYRKYIYSILDPLFVYVFTLSFSSVLIISTLGDKPFYQAHFFICHAFFFVGFTTATYLIRSKIKQDISLSAPDQFYDFEVLRLVIYALFAFYLMANIVLFYTTGFALLSDDPTIAKVENFDKGFGIILKINWGIGSFLISGLLFFILSKARKVDIILFSIVIMLTALEGSKSSLLRILIIFMLLINHKLFLSKKKITPKFKLIVPLGIVAVLGVFFTVLFKENADSDQAIFAFVRRFLYGADSTLYFYSPVNDQYFSRFRFWEFPSHLFNQILGFLRLVPLQEALGNVMVANVLPDHKGTIVGPNTPYYIEGQIYFGYYGAFVYSLLVGGSYAFFRQYFFDSRYYSAFWFVLICSICHQASALAVEVNLFLTQAFDTCFFVIPVYIFMNLAVKGRLIVRKLHF
ncbi:O-antigen polymerase [Spirosoma utsteinense]|uniref:O-antigen polymerase n=1 Tax=Spirosoma utsteinense TaxID=2585773 RepID=UPI0021CFF182|nr:O-antigen polymerase [Spirosoma utsteinense]